MKNKYVEYTRRKEESDLFNFFANIEQDMVKKLHKLIQQRQNMVKNLNRFFLYITTEIEVKRYILEINSNTSSGVDISVVYISILKKKEKQELIIKAIGKCRDNLK